MKVIGWVAGLAAALMSSSAFAGVIFSNPYALGAGGDCSFSTTCAATAGRGDDFAAQKFTLGAAVVVQGADFIELDPGVRPTDVNWGFIQADGPGGLPGTILAAGTDTLSGHSVGSDLGYDLSRMEWNVGTVALGPGTYYFAIQAVSPAFTTYLGQGVASSGAAETHDGGVTWTPGYEINPNTGAPYTSVAVDLYDTPVPEPGAWALMIVGLAATGAVLRRRQTLAVA